ncbi:hypothetical protein Cal6303_0938 [Calothrix sp. PCC 6303]|nr:hypothetical protein Cal6303_0938 [Calothrix sp. PCC 6303]
MEMRNLNKKFNIYALLFIVSDRARARQAIFMHFAKLS